MSSAAPSMDAMFVLNSLALGGSERKIVMLANRLSDGGASVGVTCLNGPESLADRLSDKIPLRVLQRKGKVSLSTLRALRRIVAATRPRSLLAVNLYPALYVATAVAATGKSRPKTVALVNTTAMNRRNFARRQFYRQLLRGLDRTVHGCDAQRSAWLVRNSAAWARSSVIYNGVDHEAFRPGAGAAAHHGLRVQYGVPPHRFVIGSVGRLATVKNQMLLIETVGCLRAANIDAHLLLVGDGPLRADLENRTRALALTDHVSFAGAVSDVRPLLGLMDVFVLPSVESFSNAALEAMAMAKPVILTLEGGGPEMLRDGVDGCLVAPTQLTRQLPCLLIDLYADGERRTRLGVAARARVIARFSIDAMVDRYRALIDVDARERLHV